MLDLGVLDQDKDSVAFAINCQADVVGTSGDLYWSQGKKRAFIWTRKKGLVDLNTCISGFEGMLLEAVDINDKGQIVCWATCDGSGQHIVLLDSVVN